MAGLLVEMLECKWDNVMAELTVKLMELLLDLKLAMQTVAK